MKCSPDAVLGRFSKPKAKAMIISDCFWSLFSLSWMFEANRISIFWVLDAVLCEKLLCAFQILMPVVRRTWRNHNGEESLGILGWRVEIKEQEKKAKLNIYFSLTKPFTNYWNTSGSLWHNRSSQAEAKWLIIVKLNETKKNKKLIDNLSP